MQAVSVWRIGASEAPLTAPLAESVHVDVAIVGAGFTGVSAALALAEGGARVAVLEARELGQGGSGLNGGQVIPGLKLDPSELLARFGPERGGDVVRFVMGTADALFQQVARHGIECDAQRHGWIQAAVSPAAMPAVEKRAAEANEWGGDGELLDAGETNDRIGCDAAAYCGGWLNRRAGSVHPLNYLHGLVRAAQRSGAQVCTRSRAIKVTSASGRWRIALSHGPSLTAGAVIIGANAYADDLWPGLRQSILAANSLQVATIPLPEAMLPSILPGRQAVSDGRRVMNYYRIGPGGRLMIGGRGPFGPATKRHYEELVRDMVRPAPW